MFEREEEPSIQPTFVSMDAAFSEEYEKHIEGFQTGVTFYSYKEENQKKKGKSKEKEQHQVEAKKICTWIKNNLNKIDIFYLDNNELKKESQNYSTEIF